MQLSQVECAKVSLVVEDTIERLALLGELAQDVGRQNEDASQGMGEEITRILEVQKKLEARYEELIMQRGQMKSLSNRAKLKENQTEIEEVAGELRYATKVLCRNLKENPNVEENIRKVQQEREYLIGLLERTVSELNLQQTFQSLVGAIEQEKAKNDKLRVAKQRVNEFNMAVKKLKQELHDEADDREREARQQNDEISSLRKELQELRANTMVETRYLRREAKARAASKRRVFDSKEKRMAKATEELQRRLATEDRVSGELEGFLREKHERLQQDIQQWIARHERDLGEKERELEVLKAMRARDLARLADLKEKYRLLQKLVLKEKTEAEARLLLSIQEKVQNRAARRIQRVWRQYIKKKQAKLRILRRKQRAKEKKQQRANFAARLAMGKRAPTPATPNSRPPDAAATSQTAQLSNSTQLNNADATNKQTLSGPSEKTMAGRQKARMHRSPSIVLREQLSASGSLPVSPTLLRVLKRVGSTAVIDVSAVKKPGGVSAAIAAATGEERVQQPKEGQLSSSLPTNFKLHSQASFKTNGSSPRAQVSPKQATPLQESESGKETPAALSRSSSAASSTAAATEVQA